MIQKDVYLALKKTMPKTSHPIRYATKFLKSVNWSHLYSDMPETYDLVTQILEYLEERGVKNTTFAILLACPTRWYFLDRK